MGYFAISSGALSHSLRDKWKIKVSSADLAGCCAERIKYHTGRVEFWQFQLQDAETTLRAEGIKFQNYPVTGGHRLQANLDPSLSERVQECQSRLKDNEESANRFRAFLAMFAATQDNDAWELNVDDVLYFNLKGADSGEEKE